MGEDCERRRIFRPRRPGNTSYNAKLVFRASHARLPVGLRTSVDGSRLGKHGPDRCDVEVSITNNWTQLIVRWSKDSRTKAAPAGVRRFQARRSSRFSDSRGSPAGRRAYVVTTTSNIPPRAEA